MPTNPATNPPSDGHRPGPLHALALRVGARLHPSKRERIRLNAHAGLRVHGQMVYTEQLPPHKPNRSELFHRRARRFKGAHADCSQYAASCAHWAGVGIVDDRDYTGTLGRKGVEVPHDKVRPGHAVFFGRYPYVHMGIMGRRGYVLGFGSQAGPDRVKLAVLIAYFAGIGRPGYAFRDLTR